MPWLCAQIGAREHYAVPRALHDSGRLTVLYTDFWAGPMWRRMKESKLGALRSLATRYHAELEDEGEKTETLKTETLKREAVKADQTKQKAEGRRQEEQSGKQKTVADEQAPENPDQSKFQLSAFSVSDFSSSKPEIVSWNGRALWWEVLRKAKTLKTETLKGEATKAESEKGNTEDGGLRMERSADGNEFQLSAFSVLDFKHSGPYHGFIEVGRRFATCVREDLKRRTDLAADTIFYAYDTGALEAFEWCREHGVKCVLNQMDPNRVEVDLVRAEEQQWPGWALEAVEVPEAYFIRREREWALADRVVVNSEFSRQALLQQGVPPEKLVVIPLCFEIKAESGKEKAETLKTETLKGERAKVESRKQKADAGKQLLDEPDRSEFQLSAFSVSAFPATPHPGPFSDQDGAGVGTDDGGLRIEGNADGNEFQLSAFSVSAFSSASPLRVLFLGQVILRKGIQYLIAAAKLLERENIQFDIVGPLGISASAIATAPKNMRFHGRTSRDQAATWYRQSHLFVLPTLSDGFAITQLEAMVHGLPVVTTPCCGEVVSDGVDGFVVPARDTEALAKVFQHYLAEPELLRKQSAAALVKARQFTQERLAENLRQLEDFLWKADPLKN